MSLRNPVGTINEKKKEQNILKSPAMLALSLSNSNSVH